MSCCMGKFVTVISDSIYPVNQATGEHVGQLRKPAAEQQTAAQKVLL